MKPDDEALKTSWTLVARIKNPEDSKSWNQFYERYRGLIIGVAMKAGLRQDEAEDVLQETMRSVTSNIGDFEANPARGSFTAWLLQMARWRIKDQLDKRLPMPAARQFLPDATGTTATMERLPDPREVDLERLCDAARKQWLMEQALKELPREVKAEHYQIFHLLEIEQKPVADVARMIGRNRAQIYLVKHRVTNALRRIAKKLENSRA